MLTENWGYHRQGSCQAGLGASVSKVRRKFSYIKIKNYVCYNIVSVKNKTKEHLFLQNHSKK